MLRAIGNAPRRLVSLFRRAKARVAMAVRRQGRLLASWRVADLSSTRGLPDTNKHERGTVGTLSDSQWQLKTDSGPNVVDSSFAPPVFTSLQLDKQHAFRTVLEVAERPEVVAALDAVTSHQLITLHDLNVYDEDTLCKWNGWGNNRAFHNGAQVLDGLQPVIDYAESSASPDVRRKLRYVTKVMLEDRTIDSRDILCLLATHGTVCNVMKEVAIRNAYGVVTNSVAATGLSLEDAVYGLLSATRELVVERVYVDAVLRPQGSHDINTHSLVSFRNSFCDKVGLLQIPDEHAHTMPVDNKTLELFWNLYNESVLRTVYLALNTQPRRLDYGAAVDFLKYNRPSAFQPVSATEDFLYECFDEMTGKFTPGALAWILYRMGVFAKVSDEAAVERECFPEVDPAASVAVEPAAANVAVEPAAEPAATSDAAAVAVDATPAAVTDVDAPAIVAAAEPDVAPEQPDARMPLIDIDAALGVVANAPTESVEPAVAHALPVVDEVARNARIMDEVDAFFGLAPSAAPSAMPCDAASSDEGVDDSSDESVEEDLTKSTGKGKQEL